MRTKCGALVVPAIQPLRDRPPTAHARSCLLLYTARIVSEELVCDLVMQMCANFLYCLFVRVPDDYAPRLHPTRVFESVAGTRWQAPPRFCVPNSDACLVQTCIGNCADEHDVSCATFCRCICFDGSLSQA